MRIPLYRNVLMPCFLLFMKIETSREFTMRLVGRTFLPTTTKEFSPISLIRPDGIISEHPPFHGLCS